VTTKNLKITWSPVKNVTAYTLNLEQRGNSASLTAHVPGSASSFAVPDGLLVPGTEYQLAIGTVSKTGNISLVETTFRTAANPR